MTAAALKAYSLKDLAKLAKKRGVSGYQTMRKDELVRALLRDVNKKSASPAGKKSAVAVARPSAPVARQVARPAVSATKPKDTRITRKIEEAKLRHTAAKDLATDTELGQNIGKDRLIVMVRGPFWLHCYWELNSATIHRARAAMGQDWHSAVPVLRVMRVDSANAGASECVERDIRIHGRVRNWYVDVQEPMQNYRLEIGYLATNGRFLGMARSNVVSTPAPDRGDVMDPHWSDVAENCDKIYAMSGGFNHDGASSELQELFEERMRRPMGSPLVTRYGAGAEGLVQRGGKLKVDLQAEVILHGNTQSDAYVTVQGEPVKVREDGGFTVRCDFPNRRQVMPIVVATKDGNQQRTIVLAIERNTKVLEPIVREATPDDEP